jgi:hypothetical protein
MTIVILDEEGIEFIRLDPMKTSKAFVKALLEILVRERKSLGVAIDVITNMDSNSIFTLPKEELDEATNYAKDTSR